MRRPVLRTIDDASLDFELMRALQECPRSVLQGLTHVSVEKREAARREVVKRLRARLDAMLILEEDRTDPTPRRSVWEGKGDL